MASSGLLIDDAPDLTLAGYGKVLWKIASRFRRRRASADLVRQSRKYFVTSCVISSKEKGRIVELGSLYRCCGGVRDGLKPKCGAYQGICWKTASRLDDTVFAGIELGLILSLESHLLQYCPFVFC